MLGLASPSVRLRPTALLLAVCGVVLAGLSPSSDAAAPSRGNHEGSGPTTAVAGLKPALSIPHINYRIGEKAKFEVRVSPRLMRLLDCDPCLVRDEQEYRRTPTSSREFRPGRVERVARGNQRTFVIRRAVRPGRNSVRAAIAGSRGGPWYTSDHTIVAGRRYARMSLAIDTTWPASAQPALVRGRVSPPTDRVTLQEKVGEQRWRTLARPRVDRGRFQHRLRTARASTYRVIRAEDDRAIRTYKHAAVPQPGYAGRLPTDSRTHEPTRYGPLGTRWTFEVSAARGVTISTADAVYRALLIRPDGSQVAFPDSRMLVHRVTTPGTYQLYVDSYEGSSVYRPDHRIVAAPDQTVRAEIDDWTELPHTEGRIRRELLLPDGDRDLLMSHVSGCTALSTGTASHAPIFLPGGVVWRSRRSTSGGSSSILVEPYCRREARNVPTDRVRLDTVAALEAEPETPVVVPAGRRWTAVSLHLGPRGLTTVGSPAGQITPPSFLVDDRHFSPEDASAGAQIVGGRTTMYVDTRDREAPVELTVCGVGPAVTATAGEPIDVTSGPCPQRVVPVTVRTGTGSSRFRVEIDGEIASCYLDTSFPNGPRPCRDVGTDRDGNARIQLVVRAQERARSAVILTGSR